jgi:hypothetical protein
MDESRVELSVGESLRLDDQILTVLDIHGDEITFRIDPVTGSESGGPFGGPGAGLGGILRPPR